ncbi:MAG: hypothetical protein K0S60_191 [Evtepia sp.]|nr:hypothetical protein [Evtepia sp.]
MLDFKPTKVSDRQWVLPLLQAEAIPLCSYSFAALFCWQNVYEQKICRFENRLLVHANTSVGSAYLWPVGSGDPIPALRALEEDAALRGEPLRLVALMEQHRIILEQLFAGRIEIVTSRDTYDYQYEINRLADLPGKKLHAKRNHIRRFQDNCPDGMFAPLTPEDIPDCLALDQRWYEEHQNRSSEGLDEADESSLLQERAALVRALENFNELGLDGGLIRCNGTVLAFTLGSLLTPTVFDVHFERALADFQGAFPVVNQEFSRFIRDHYPQVEYIDREEDLGQPGLRKAKLSYGPDRLVENFCAVIQTTAD